MSSTVILQVDYYSLSRLRDRAKLRLLRHASRLYIPLTNSSFLFISGFGLTPEEKSAATASAFAAAANEVRMTPDYYRSAQPSANPDPNATPPNDSLEEGLLPPPPPLKRNPRIRPSHSGYIGTFT